MPDVVAKAMAVITGMLLVLVLAALVVTSRPPAGSREIVAEFRDAFPMIEGMQVRTDGAPAGSVGTIEVNDAGLAEVTLLVDTAIPAPRANASAAIRQADTTGDSYIAYDPGTEGGELPERDGRPVIDCAAPGPTDPCTNTLAAPRLDDLINAFGPPEQAGVKLILENLSQALDQRGADVNRAALDLLPALDAANAAVSEVSGQNEALKRLIEDMEDVSGQAASRREELGRLIEGLDRTLFATAQRTAALDAGLEALPETEAQLRSTLGELSRAATAARPLGTQLAGAAPQLRTLLERAPSFVRDVRGAVRQGRPTLELTRELLEAGGPTIEADPERLVTGAFDLAPALSNLLKGILGGDDTIKAFFGDETNGGPESREEFGFGLGAVTSDPGNLPGYPADWANRTFLRFGLTLNCQMFGVPIGPGCLADLLAGRAARDRRSERSAPPRKTRPRSPARPRPQVRLPRLPVDELEKTLRNPVDRVREVVEQAGNLLEPTLDQVGKLGREPVSPKTVEDLLDFLLK